MVRLLSSLIASLLLTSASAVSAQSVCHGKPSCLTSQGGLNPGEHLLDSTNIATAQYLLNGDVMTDVGGIPDWFSRTAGVASNRFRVTNDGRLELAMVSGTTSSNVRYISTNAAQTTLGDYRMEFGPSYILTVLSATHNVIWSANVDMDSVITSIWFFYRDSNPMIQNDAISIYLPDSGYNSFYDFAFTVPRWVGTTVVYDPIAKPNLFQTFSSDTNYNDLIHHGTTELMLLSSSAAGVAPNTTVHVIKITNGTSPTVREPDVVRSIRAAFTHVTGKPKVINLSLSFGCDWPQTIRCAMQWAYRAGIVVVAAAGNNNTNCRSRLQYAFVVGGAFASWHEQQNNATTLRTSNYGNMVDGWALGSVQDPIRAGTSYASAIVSGAAAYSMFKIPSLRNNPAAVFSYLRHHAHYRITSTDLKVVYSRHASNRLIRSSTLTFIPPTNWTAITEFCTNFTGAGLPTINPTSTHWNTLVARAYTSNRNGSLVHDTTYDFLARIIDYPIIP
jgi:hypothetical protein